MKKEFVTAVVCVCAILCYGCKEKAQKRGGDPGEVKTITLSSIEGGCADTSYFKDPQVVVLETREESFLSEITRIFMDDGILFIFDDHLDKVVMFDITGKYLGNIYSKGQGPREHTQVTDFTIDPDRKQIILLCDIPYKRMYFTYDGEFVSEESFSGLNVEIAGEDNYIYLIKNDQQEFGKKQLTIVDTKTGEIQEELNTMDIKNGCVLAGKSFSRGKNILFVRRFDNSIYELKEGEIRKKYQVDFKDHTFPDRYMTEEDCGVIFNESSEHKYIYSMSNAVENDNHLMFYTNLGFFLYDKKHDTLTGYRLMRNSDLFPLAREVFSNYLPLENTDKIVFSFEDPSFIKDMATLITANPDKLKEKIKKMREEYPESVEKVLSIASKMTDDNNPVLFIYEFKD